MQKAINSKVRGLVSSIIFALVLILDLVMMFGSPKSSRESIFGAAKLWNEDSNVIPIICVLFVAVFVVNVAVAVVGSIVAFRGKKTHIWPSTALLLSHILLLASNSAFEALKSNAVLIIALVVSVGAVAFSFLCGLFENKVEKGTGDTKTKSYLSLIGCISAFLSLTLFFIPICNYRFKHADYNIFPMGVFSPNEDSGINFVLFLLMIAAATINAFFLSAGLKQHSGEISAFATKIRRVVNFNLIVTGAYFVAGVAICSFSNGEDAFYSTSCYIPFVIMSVVALANAFVTRKIVSPELPETEKVFNKPKIELFVLGLAMSVVTVIASLSNILTISFAEPSDINDIVVNGYDILMTYNSLESGMQLVAFIIMAALTVIIALAVASSVALIGKSKFFYEITLAEIICSAIFSLLLGLLGKYYEVVQHLNEEVMKSIIESAGSPAYVELDYRVSSSSFIWFLIAMVIIAVILIRKPYSKSAVGETPIAVNGTLMDGSVSTVSSGVVAGVSSSKVAGSSAVALTSAVGGQAMTSAAVEKDPCPAFTELDKKVPAFTKATLVRKESTYQSPTLPDVVQFIVNYARDCRLHLSYTPEDIATFVAGLGATRLTILQGMSGTGKTSLPKIFSEAILGNCDIIEVESSWRDKNELLGYYNEFSKTYTPKKFTQALYKARLNPETVTFIVLDEMNLSRIEYYFSDFLSLMENEEDQREIKLLNVNLNRTEDGKLVPYYGLFEGHTIRIPRNVWFVGTANRDESTFEISDKVYDRAHTMNFNKRAVKPLSYGEPIAQRYLTVDTFMSLLENAKSTVRFSVDRYPLIKEVEALLEPYNISFGNRIANQIEVFVSIYCSCFTDPASVLKDAIEKILLSKVVSKLEFKSVENKAQLAAKFEKLGLKRCSEFILKLNED